MEEFHNNSEDDASIVQSKCPGSTIEECHRFLIARNCNVNVATKMLKKHITWREATLRTNPDDSNVNVNSSHLRSASSPQQQRSITKTFLKRIRRCTSSKKVQKLDIHSHRISTSSQTNVQMNGVRRGSDSTLNSLSTVMSSSEPTTNNSNPPKILLPQLVYLNSNGPYARDGTRIAHVFPSMINANLASPLQYAIHVATNLDQQLARNSMEKVTGFIDVRGGMGWANPTPLKLVPYMKAFSHLLNNQFPERLAKCVVYPIPPSAMKIWTVMKMFMEPQTLKKMVLVVANSEPSSEELMRHFDEATIDMLEQRRLSLYVDSEKPP
eukprot:CAMPEP_0195522894 /NCGR_PEP_ID=MMETSP0794_2-20130614/21504_1 /TAXON_ID=515487 /ORGANISM="Stephanopyxis turris, Strain CCMP 815" /LENGTH=324 /DNA_ID=CAMNT_0040652759 /DNA_START=142 /DNA_END=1116 /DNA_ORIENTATION=-